MHSILHVLTLGLLFIGYVYPLDHTFEEAALFDEPRVRIEISRCGDSTSSVNTLWAVANTTLSYLASCERCRTTERSDARFFLEKTRDSDPVVRAILGSTSLTVSVNLVSTVLTLEVLSLAPAVDGDKELLVTVVNNATAKIVPLVQSNFTYAKVNYPGDELPILEHLVTDGHVPLKEPDRRSVQDRLAAQQIDQTRILRALCRGEQNAWGVMDNQNTLFWEFLENIKILKSKGFVQSHERTVVSTSNETKVFATLSLTNRGMETIACNSTSPSLPSCVNTSRPFYGTLNDQDCLLNGESWLSQVFDHIAEHEARPADILQWDQGRIHSADVLRRAAFIHAHHDLLNASIVVFGDDDLFGLAVALTKLPARVVVLEADERLVQFINEVARRLRLNVAARVYDFRAPLPVDLIGQFDVFSTDSVESVPGIGTTLSRATEALRGPGCAGYFGVTTKEASRQAWRFIQYALFKMQFVITDIRDRFSTYDECTGDDMYTQVTEAFGSEKASRCSHDFYRSALYRVEAVAQPKPLFTGPSGLNISEFVQTGAGTLIWENNYYNEQDPSFPENTAANTFAKTMAEHMEAAVKEPISTTLPRVSEIGDLTTFKSNCRPIARKGPVCQDITHAKYCSASTTPKYFRSNSEDTFTEGREQAYALCDSEVAFRKFQSAYCPQSPQTVSRVACLRALGFEDDEESFCMAPLACERDEDCSKYHPCFNVCLRCHGPANCYLSILDRLRGKIRTKGGLAFAFPGAQCRDPLSGHLHPSSNGFAEENVTVESLSHSIAMEYGDHVLAEWEARREA